MEHYNNYYEGIFWVPGNENSKTIGMLHIDKNGNAIISSLQSLGENKEKEAIVRKWDKIKILFGHINCHNTSKNYSIKLYEIFQIYQSNGALTKFKYKSSKSFISQKHDSEIGNLSYDSIMLSSNIISHWIPISGFNFEFNYNEDNVFRESQLYEQPKQIDLFKNDKYSIYIYFRASSGYPARRNSYIKEEVFLNIETTESFELKEFYKIKSLIERLLNIVLFIPFYSTTVEFKSTSGINYKALKKSKELITGLDNLLEFEIFRENSQKIFEQWFEKQIKLELFIKNFFSVYGQKGVLVENKFLTYISVLENYHKNNIKKKALLKSRLLYVLENSSINEKISNIDKYAEKLKVTRNYHAHLEEKHENKALNIDGIMKSNQLLEVVIHEIFLQEIGIEEFKIPNWLEELTLKINEYLI